MIEAAGIEVINLAHRDFIGATGLEQALTSGSTCFISASFRMPAGTPTPWKSTVVVERGGSSVAFIGVAVRSAALGLPISFSAASSDRRK